MENISFEQLPKAVSLLFTKLDHLEGLISKLEPTPNEEPDKLLTVDQAAEFLNLSKPTIYSKVNRRELPVMKRGKRLYFSKNELLDYLKAGRKKTNTDIEEETNDYVNSTEQ